jgi:hypothetical protein
LVDKYICLNTLPFISKAVSDTKIVTNSGDIFYAHNLKPEYRFDERKAALRSFRTYFTSINNPSPEQDAYAALMWHLFPDFLNAYNFNYVRPENKADKHKHLYILLNSKGFIKVGIAGNVEARLVDLKYEFEGDWTILKVYPSMGNLEKYVHERLMEFIHPVKKRHTNKYSTECFTDCEAVRSVCLNLS